MRCYIITIIYILTIQPTVLHMFPWSDVALRMYSVANSDSKRAFSGRGKKHDLDLVMTQISATMQQLTKSTTCMAELPEKCKQFAFSLYAESVDDVNKLRYMFVCFYEKKTHLSCTKKVCAVDQLLNIVWSSPGHAWYPMSTWTWLGG